MLSLIILSATPIAGLAVLLGIDRFEKFVLDEHGQRHAVDSVPEAAIDITASAVAAHTEPATRAAA